MKALIIRHLLLWLAGITARQWATALQWVVLAAKDARYKNGAERKEAVRLFLIKYWPDLEGNSVNLLIESALAYYRRTK